VPTATVTSYLGDRLVTPTPASSPATTATASPSA
jgi:hypothetical protein